MLAAWQRVVYVMTRSTVDVPRGALVCVPAVDAQAGDESDGVGALPGREPQVGQALAEGRAVEPARRHHVHHRVARHHLLRQQQQRW